PGFKKRETKPIEGAAGVEPGDGGAAVSVAAAGKLEDGGNVGEVDLAEIAADALDGIAEEAARGGQGQVTEGIGAQDDGAAIRGEMEGGEFLDFGVPVRFFGERPIGGVGEGAVNGGIPIASKFGEEFVTQAIAGEVRGEVGGIVAPGQAALAEE